MAITRQEEFVRDEVLPSWWANRIQDRLAPMLKFRLRRVDATTIEAVAGADDDASALNIDGQWRFVEAPVQRAHPGGAAGFYTVWVTARAQDITNAPLPNTDETDYSFDLAIVEGIGAAPAIVPGVVDVARRVGRLEWDGDEIVQLWQEAGEVGGPQIRDDALTVGTGIVKQRQPDGSILFMLGDHAATHAPGGDDPLDLTLSRRSGVYADRPPASGALNGVTYFATDKLMTWQCIGGAWVLVHAQPVIVAGGAALPANPIDGQEMLLDWTNGMLPGCFAHCVWRDVAGVGLWRVIGSPSWSLRSTQARAFVAAENTVVLTGTATGPLPYGGIYEVDYHAQIGWDSATHTAALILGGVRADMFTAFEFERITEAAQQGWGGNLSRSGRHITVATGESVRLTISGDGNHTVNERVLALRPVRFS